MALPYVTRYARTNQCNLAVLKRYILHKINNMILINRNKIIIICTIFILALIIVYIVKTIPQKAIQTSTKASKYEILVDVEESKLYLLEDSILSKTYKCSGRKMVNSITDRNMENSRKRHMG